MPETLIKAGQEQFKYYPYSGIFHLTRNTFYTAGQDSFTQAPAQDPDLFAQMVNIEPVVQGTLQRRRGYTLFTNGLTTSQPYQRSYAFRSDGLGLRRYIFSSAAGVNATDEAGNVILDPVLTVSNGALFPPRMVLSRNYGYFTDGLVADSKKWDGTTNATSLTNWGIGTGLTPVTTFGPQNAGSAADVAAGGAVAWSNPGNFTGPSDGVFSTVALTFAQRSHQLQATNFGFSIPNTVGPITGIQVTLTGKYSGTIGAGTNNSSNGVVLLKNGVVVGTSHSTPLTTTNASVTVGGFNDLWGTTWTPSDINNVNFGVLFQGYAASIGDNFTLYVDSVNITVYTAGGTLTFTTSVATTNIVLLSGRTYFTAFENSSTLTVSSLSPPSISTGPLPGNQVNLSNIPISGDPQVDTVLILATLDGNDQTTLYLVGTVPNGTTTFIDTTPDSVTAAHPVGLSLITNALYQNTDINGNPHGIANNNPPPVGLNFPTKHKGRIFGAVGRALYFSKNLDDVTTANGLITSKWEEAWPLTYQFDISETAETIVGLLSDGETLWIGTERGIRRLVGDSPANFQKPEIQFNEVGLLTQDVWKVVFYEGQPVGTIWVTPDFRVMASDFNTYEDIGKPIQDILNTITQDGSRQYNCHASFVSQGPFDLYMLYLSTNGNVYPNVVCVYNLRTKKWVIWNPTDIITTSLFNINGTGVPQWIFAANPGGNPPIYFWDPAVRQDRNGNTPVSYLAQVITSWLSFGDETLLKALNQAIVYTGDSNLYLTVFGAKTQADLQFSGGDVVVPATTVQAGPLGGYLFVPMAGRQSKHYWYQLAFSSPASTQQVVLGGYNFETIPVVRV